MEQAWYLSSLIVVVLAIATVVWQAFHYTGYERTRIETCESKLEKSEAAREELRIENERLQLLLMGAGVRISGAHVDVRVNRDLIGGNANEQSNQ